MSKISVVVVVYNMQREAARTLHSLSAAYQRGINPGDYEVIVVDNGSNPPFDSSAIGNLPGNFRFVRVASPTPSPAGAANRGLAEARYDVIGVMIDGARIVTPGLLHFARAGAALSERAVVATVGWYLGFDFQRWAIRHGYNQDREDALLAQIRWPADGYRLFEVATPDESSVDGWLQPIAESNALFMTRRSWDALAGFDERFDDPGGGLVNHDIFRRALEAPGAHLVHLLGEATFHQLHNGVATNSPVEEAEANWKRWVQQYERITGRSYSWPRPQQRPEYVGSLTPVTSLRFAWSALHPVPRVLVEGPGAASVEAERSPIGINRLPNVWPEPSAPRAPSPAAALINLMREQVEAGHYASAAGIARLVRQHWPDESEPQRVLSFLAPYSPEPWDSVYAENLSKANDLLAACGQSR